MGQPEQVPALVVGAGLGGSSAAMFLGLHGVPALVVDRHPSTSNQPKARGQSWHTMEALRVAGVAERVRAAGYDVDLGMPIVIAQSVSGPIIHEILGEKWPDFSHITPERMAMASQESVEPILLERAGEFGVETRFSTRLDSLDQDEEGVTARLTDLRGAREYEVRAEYVIAADGPGSRIRQQLGVGTHGYGDLSHSVTVLFEADLAELVAQREFALFYLQNPELGDGGAFVSTDVPGRWIVQFGYDPASGQRPEDFTTDELIRKVRVAVGIEDLEVKLLDRASTSMMHRVADTFSRGRVHLIGDAAHTMPPHGGQGGNTAIMDGFYLAWKVAAVVRGWAGPGLLDTHDAERRPYGDLIAGQQYTNMILRSAPHLADGTEDAPVPPEQQLLGYRYPDGAVLAEPDEDGARLEDPAHPTGRPGSRAPHVWLPGGQSTIDLFGRDFVLLTAAVEWARIAERVADRLDVPLRAEVLGGSQWQWAYGVDSEGACLVRPDRFIAWRSIGAGSADELERALRVVLRLAQPDGPSGAAAGNPLWIV